MHLLSVTDSVPTILSFIFLNVLVQQQLRLIKIWQSRNTNQVARIKKTRFTLGVDGVDLAFSAILKDLALFNASKNT